MALPRRHDLVWLDPDAPRTVWGAAPEVVADWIAAGLPFVAARREGGRQDQLRLGFTRPGLGPRHRVTVTAPVAALERQGDAPTLSSLLPRLPANWQPALADLDVALKAVDCVARLFGSAVTHCLTGQATLRADSDLDLLLDCVDGEQVAAVLSILAAADVVAGLPRLDGEIRFPSGWAVSWRELAQVWPVSEVSTEVPTEAQVLAKADQALALMRVADLIGEPCPA
ncbi:hypothetical protein DLREEDagrD3_23220 [Denitratisoma sp. agr-D3]